MKRGHRKRAPISWRLMLVFIILAVTTVYGVNWAVKIFHNTATSYRLIEQVRERYYEQSAIAFAETQLYEESAHNDIDSLSDSWHEPVTIKNRYGDLVTVVIEDAQSKLNINNLVTYRHTLNQNSKVILENWAKSRGFDDDFIYFLAEYLGWNPQKEGATGRYPTGSELPRDEVLEDMNELKNVPNLSSEIRFALSKDFTALPVFTSININTATKMTLRSLSLELTDYDIDTVKKQQKRQPIKDVESYWEAVSQKFKQTPASMKRILSNNSEWFWVNINIIIDDRVYTHKHLTHRPTLKDMSEIGKDQS
ncbi:type II secretion system protein GspK [Vibrio sp.]|nr:type II secretion system protein GspK [Vibrio sp.]